jgi:hypothetical protein
MTTEPNGAVLYSGPSMIDGVPIVAIVTGLRRPSANRKTGDMLQTWIMRQDVAPHVAIKTGADVSVCGGCPLRGKALGDSNKGRVCYVVTHQGPRSVWVAWTKGRYPDALSLAHVADIGSGRFVRLGSYGDPCAVPFEVWNAFTRDSSGWTGYTRGWSRTGDRNAQALRSLCMASTSTDAQRRAAELAGWRTFHVRPAGAPVPEGMIDCPAVTDGTACEACRLCDGLSSRAGGIGSVSIGAHGNGAGALS